MVKPETVALASPPDSVCADAADEATTNRSVAEKQRSRNADRLARGAFIGIGGLVRVIGAPYQRPGLDVHEPEIERDLLQIAEFVGVIIADHRRVLIGR